MTFDEFFQKQWPDHWATLKMYDEGSPAVDYFDVMLPKRLKAATEIAWNAGRKAALLEAAEKFDN